MGHIRKLPNGRFETRYRAPDGKERSKRFATRRDARAHLDQVGVDRRVGTWHDPRAGRTLLAEWVRQWEGTSVHLRASSRARDASYLRNHVLPRFGPMRLDAIAVVDVREWVADLSGSGLAPATVQKAYQTLSKILRGAVDAGLLAQSPCRGVDLPRIEREEMRFLDPEQIAALAAGIDKRYRAMVLLGGYGGLRLGELAGLRRSRVDLAVGRVEVAEVVVEVRGHHQFGPPKTRAGRRSVPLPRLVVQALKAHVADLEPDAFVFAAPNGGPMRASQFRRRFWQPAAVATGLGDWKRAEPGPGEDEGAIVGYAGLRIHDLRHTAVALWIAAGANPKQIAAWAGHTSVSVVLDRYGHLFEGHETAVLSQLDSLARQGSSTSGATAKRPGEPALRVARRLSA
ncbi:MAG: tyrosine-type recombinase/integrase [Acidimicrobiia bacterium]